jgi:hypothetical protein
MIKPGAWKRRECYIMRMVIMMIMVSVKRKKILIMRILAQGVMVGVKRIMKIRIMIRRLMTEGMVMVLRMVKNYNHQDNTDRELVVLIRKVIMMIMIWIIMTRNGGFI